MPILKSYEKKLRQIHLIQSVSKQSGEWGISLLKRNFLKKLLPSRLLWRLTIVNTVVIIVMMTLIGWAVYETACSITEGMGNLGEQRQQQFNATLLQYVISFVIVGIIIAVSLHIYITQKIIEPIKQLIESTKQMKRGSYPARIKIKAGGELVELVDQFNELIDQLEKNEYERDKLVTDLSHEVRTPLSNISGYLQALQSGVMEPTEELYSSLLNEANRLKEMMNQLDQLKQWDQNSLTYKEQVEFDIKGIVDQVVAMFSWSLKQRNIPLTAKVERRRLKGNASGIEQAITNILANAIEYYKGDGEIEISGVVENNDYVIMISGPGDEISSKDKQQIFKRFFRVEASRNRKTGGSGLGLAIAKEIIHYHEGTIQFVSENQRNAVMFSIPLQ